MGVFTVLGLIFLGICVCVSIPVIAQTSILVEDDKEKEGRYRELNTISEEENEIMSQILEQHKWIEKYSPTYVHYGSVEYIDANVAEGAANLAIKYAQEFATSNGYDVKIITKLYYMYNMKHGNLSVGPTSYKMEQMPSKRDVLTGRITHGYAYSTCHTTWYHIRFFVLESKT